MFVSHSTQKIYCERVMGYAGICLLKKNKLISGIAWNFLTKSNTLRKFQGIFWWHSRTCPAVWSEACSLKVWTIERYFSMLKLGESDHRKPNSFSESLEISKQRSDIRKLWKNLSVENLWKFLTAGHKLFETMPDSV